MSIYKVSKLSNLIIVVLIIFCLTEYNKSDVSNGIKVQTAGFTSSFTLDTLTVKLPTKVKTVETKKATSKKHKSIPNSKKADQFKMRKYAHVTELYMDLAPSVIKLCVKNNVPPAAILAIVSLESGWGSGYISQITGNILSLNATKGRAELPALHLPILKKNGQILFDEKEIAKYSSDELEYQDRPASLKRDYRPAGIAGTKENLAYFKYHHDEKVKAEIKCINDFITRFISYKSSITAYREARTNMDRHVSERGTQALFDRDVNIEFINTIGGRPSSFNFRESWPKKVELILNNTGLIELTNDMGMKDSAFHETW